MQIDPIVVALAAVVSAVSVEFYRRLRNTDARQEKRIEKLEVKIEECNDDRQCLREALIGAQIPIPARRTDGGG
jgi:hypothetical protein